MRTIQEYLKEADMDRLVAEFFKTHPAEYESEDRMDLSVRQIRENMENHLVEYIHRLQSMEITTDKENEEPILFAHKYLRDGYDDITYSLLYKRELLEKGTEASTYSYILCRHPEVMGYLVSDADLTQKNIYGLMADVLWETSYFGYEEEKLENAIKDMEESVAEIKRGEGITVSAEEMFGEDEEETDELEEQLYHRCTDASNDYDDYSRKKEMEILRQLLLGKDKESLIGFVYYDDAEFTRMERQYKGTYIPTFDEKTGLWVVDTEHGVEFGSSSYVAGEFCGDNATYLFNNSNCPDPEQPSHCHEFPGVIKELIREPEMFSVEAFKDCYATQELRILKNLKEALLTVKKRNYPLSLEEKRQNRERDQAFLLAKANTQYNAEGQAVLASDDEWRDETD
jgi:hypothetical protein